ncbi:hypothetical protein, unlikely [Trypanosoma brucei gambiense DAL972]|uniref:Uncharacterized protein n=1 Tax=Trypanosoma brucei gambiense (strain MHOM/CI/86/DAL972) TaxID=679716 RepID=C9ZU47_TRYB9|nr:hypothetical protein, unlikely [Trypanosoma brucei gambiense DAL972]CBH12933.1 hypothetical protein, unlikely [Trypanosoma brucei gambiense DAL972]|eukprot:XP_011775212.1 hypothetical protein, unlikely [Trypanosoma brucei gambiense DAL972]
MAPTREYTFPPAYYYVVPQRSDATGAGTLSLWGQLRVLEERHAEYAHTTTNYILAAPPPRQCAAARCPFLPRPRDNQKEGKPRREPTADVSHSHPHACRLNELNKRRPAPSPKPNSQNSGGQARAKTADEPPNTFDPARSHIANGRWA